MNGSSIEAARRALHAILSELEFEDRFSLSRFGSRVEHLDEGLQPVTDETIARAGKAVMGLLADLGGTELAAALASTLARDKGERADVLLITDGQSWNAEGIVKTAQASGQRVFVVGIGAASAESLLRKLAEETGGACEFVAPNQGVQQADLRTPWLRAVRKDRAENAWLGITRRAAPTSSQAKDLGADKDQARQGPHRRYAEGWGPVRGWGRDAQARGGTACRPCPLVVLAEGDDVRLGRRQHGQPPRDPRRRTPAVAWKSGGGWSPPHIKRLLLIVHERAEGEKATALPQLQTIAQMHAAGWGGLSTVHRREAPDRDISSRVSNARNIFSGVGALDMVPEGVACVRSFDIERRIPEARSDREELEHFLAGLEAAISDQAEGLTLPTSIDGLRRIGLDESLAADLRARVDAGNTEDRVVRAFLVLLLPQAQALDFRAEAQRALRHLPATVTEHEALRHEIAAWVAKASVPMIWL